jgi:ABC-type nitrate/sulfonate/bicarbonate transport system permease component
MLRPSLRTQLFSALLTIALVLAVWFAVAEYVSWLRGVDFPSPWTTGKALAALLAGKPLAAHSLYQHLIDSLCRWGGGFAIAAVAGLVYGLAAGCSDRLGRITLPIVHMLQLIPGLAWIPVALLLFGIGAKATVFMIAATAFAPIAINVTDGVKRVDATYLRAARMLGAGGWQLVGCVLLPGALPQILCGLRVGLGSGWRVLLAAEMIVGTGTGLGYAIIQSRWTLDYPAAFACMAVICVVGLLIEHGLFARLERATVTRWHLSSSV